MQPRNKPTKYVSVSSSKLAHFFKCPRMMHLSRHHKPVFGTSTKSVMEAGLLFEGYVLGFKDRTEAELIGRKKKPTIDKIKGHAAAVAPVFAGFTSEYYAPKVFVYADEFQEKLRNNKGHDIAVTEFDFNDWESSGIDHAILDNWPELDIFGMKDQHTFNHYGTAYNFMTHDHDALQVTIRGEADYIGFVNEAALHDAIGRTLPKIGKAIWDVKYTGNISRVWDWKEKREEYLQACKYTYLHHKENGEHLPFFYLVIEYTYDRPLVRLIRVDVTEQDWQWLESIIAETNQGFNITAMPSYETCLGGKSGGRCWFLEHCNAGRALCGGYQSISFSDLPSNY